MTSAEQRAWTGRYTWAEDGDEWKGMARHCGQPYDTWKQSLIDTFIDPHVTPGDHVVEIAAGHGRWTEPLLNRAATVTIVEVDQESIDTCRVRFARAGDRLRTHLTDAYLMPVVADGSAGFVWSFDSMVHMPPAVIRGYLGEIHRVLRPGGTAVLHHAGLRNRALWLAPLYKAGLPGRAAFRVAAQGRVSHGGSRSAVSREALGRWAVDAGLEVVNQTRAWGNRGQFTVERFGDWVSTLRRI